MMITTSFALVLFCFVCRFGIGWGVFVGKTYAGGDLEFCCGDGGSFLFLPMTPVEGGEL